VKITKAGINRLQRGGFPGRRSEDTIIIIFRRRLKELETGGSFPRLLSMADYGMNGAETFGCRVRELTDW
jgi:hypothetical protein